MGNPRVVIAVVEDDAGVRTAMRQLLRSARFDALTYASAEELLAARADTSIDCLIADVNLPGMSGVALWQTLGTRGWTVPTVLVTGRDDPATQELLRQAGSVPRLHKPFSDDELFEAIRVAMQA